MAENIMVAVLTIIATGAAIWCRWYESHGTDVKK